MGVYRIQVENRINHFIFSSGRFKGNNKEGTRNWININTENKRFSTVKNSIKRKPKADQHYIRLLHYTTVKESWKVRAKNRRYTDKKHFPGTHSLFFYTRRHHHEKKLKRKELNN